MKQTQGPDPSGRGKSSQFFLSWFTLKDQKRRKLLGLLSRCFDQEPPSGLLESPWPLSWKWKQKERVHKTRDVRPKSTRGEVFPGHPGPRTTSKQTNLLPVPKVTIQKRRPVASEMGKTLVIYNLIILAYYFPATTMTTTTTTPNGGRCQFLRLESFLFLYTKPTSKFWC